MGLFRFLFLSGEITISSSVVRSTASIAMSLMHHKHRFYHLKLSKYSVSRIKILSGLKNLWFYISYRTLEWLFHVLHYSYATVSLSRHKFDASVCECDVQIKTPSSVIIQLWSRSNEWPFWRIIRIMMVTRLQSLIYTRPHS